jgi:hypothetical protein
MLCCAHDWSDIEVVWGTFGFAPKRKWEGFCYENGTGIQRGAGLPFAAPRDSRFLTGLSALFGMTKLL